MLKEPFAKELPPSPSSPDDVWLDLDQLASVQVSSEDPESPVEGALLPNEDRGWRAAEPGEQVLRLQFSEPQSVRRVHLEFVEEEASRTQEFVLRWARAGTAGFEDVVRQQFTFSPSGATRQVEDYRVNLVEVSALELRIVPDISRGNAVASLKRFALGR